MDTLSYMAFDKPRQCVHRLDKAHRGCDVCYECTECRFSTNSQNHIYSSNLEAVHILRQPPERGEGVGQMLTIADQGREGGKPIADDC